MSPTFSIKVPCNGVYVAVATGLTQIEAWEESREFTRFIIEEETEAL